MVPQSFLSFYTNLPAAFSAHFTSPSPSFTSQKFSKIEMIKVDKLLTVEEIDPLLKEYISLANVKKFQVLDSNSTSYSEVHFDIHYVFVHNQFFGLQFESPSILCGLLPVIFQKFVYNIKCLWG